MHMTHPRRHPFKRNTLSAALLLGLSAHAVAAFDPVTPSTRREVTDGTANNVIPAGSTVAAATNGAMQNAAIRAINTGSAIHGEDLTITAANAQGQANGYGVVAQAGGSVVLTGESTHIHASTGLYADDADSSVSMSGGSIDARNRAVEYHNGGSVSLYGVDISVTQLPFGTYAIVAEGTGGALRIEDNAGTRSNIVSKGGGVGLNSFNFAGASHDVTIRNTDITVGDSTDQTIGNYQHAVTLFGTGAGSPQDTNVTLENVNITAHGHEMAGVNAHTGTTRLINTHIETLGSGGNAYGIYAHNEGTRMDMTGGSITTHGLTLSTGSSWGVGVGPRAEIHLDGVHLSKLSAGGGTAIQFGRSKLSFKNGTVDGGQSAAGFYLWGANSTLSVENSSVAMTADNASAIRSVSENHIVGIKNSTIRTSGKESAAIFGTSTTYDIRGDNPDKSDNTIETTGENSHALIARFNSSGDIVNSVLSTSGDNSYGLWTYTGQASGDSFGIRVTNSDIKTSGSGSIGLAFQGTSISAAMGGPAFADALWANHVTLDRANLTSEKSIAIFSGGGVNTLNLNNGSLAAGDRLAYANTLSQRDSSGNILNSWGGSLTINADNSRLFGHTAIANAALPTSDAPRLALNLRNNSVWTLRPSQTVAINGTKQSDVSVLNLHDSTIEFAPPAPGSDLQDTNTWQTLVIGSGAPGTSAVYNASGNAHITLNALLNEGGDLGEQYTDRLLIHGDVSGTTWLTINPMANGAFSGLTSSDGDHKNHEGISLIQVSGKASVDAFKLAGGYIALNGQPWQYHLEAYGPDADARDRARADQRLVEGTGDDHWGFRLHSSETPAPQVSNYVLAPTALFASGLQDIGALHSRLGDIRMADNHAGEAFLRAYGGDTNQINYRADRSSDGHYYDADIRYGAIQGGGSVYGMQNAVSRMRFGFAANIGSLSLTPKGVEDSRKHSLKTWAASPYVTWQHDSGAYLDALALVGKFKGDVSTNLRGRTNQLKGNRYGASVEVGLPIALPMANNLTIIPQVQVVYQRLKFDAGRDVDGFPVNIGSPKQVALRLGAQVQTLFQNIPGTGSGSNIRVYGKMHLVKHFDKDQSVWLGDDFNASKFGTNLEAGIGLNARLTKVGGTAYAELNRQQRIGSHGSQGWTFTLGAKLPF